MDSDKIVTLNWNIKVDDEFRKLQLDRPIRIGYAGRITTLAKRVDYIPIIIEKLNDIGVNYIFEIAGIGDYYDDLPNQNNLYIYPVFSRNPLYNFYLSDLINILSL